MPGLDGTGPWGMGPMTGRGLGLCNPYGPFGRGWWWRGRGFGRGFGWRWRWFAPPYAPYPYYWNPYYEMSPEEELNMLRDEAEMLKRELDAIEKRISEIEAEASK